jgi:alkylhydroperoxidase family enzyme
VSVAIIVDWDDTVHVSGARSELFPTDADVVAVKTAGYDDAEVIEIVAHVALNTLTNYMNEVAKPEIDFPVVHRNAK